MTETRMECYLEKREKLLTDIRRRKRVNRVFIRIIIFIDITVQLQYYYCYVLCNYVIILFSFFNCTREKDNFILRYKSNKWYTGCSWYCQPTFFRSLFASKRMKKNRILQPLIINLIACINLFFFFIFVLYSLIRRGVDL